MSIRDVARQQVKTLVRDLADDLPDRGSHEAVSSVLLGHILVEIRTIRMIMEGDGPQPDPE